MRNNSEVKVLDLKETQMAIKSLKEYFQRDLANTLNLARISAPIIVQPETGMNDNLSGVEKAVGFDFKNYDIGVEIVQSLAKWKRYALKEYNFHCYEGLYADMNALRPNEDLDALHSVYVDQWDWEKIIKAGDRNIEFLKSTVRQIYEVFKRAEEYINQVYPHALSKKLPDEITFITSEELLQMYPEMTSEQRENAFVKEKGAIFVIGIGGALSSGEPHDARSADYDDWNLNGDIIFYDEVLDRGIELSSMGIRVDKAALERQLEISGRTFLKELDYHKGILEDTLPLTIGGGIGQSRLCMFFLEKRHIGEVQASVWDDKTKTACIEAGIKLL
ncbi:aspartate--ammonia ligase [Peptoniphilus equinus]|uniref:Aspartate--ammonia ligase n=1 Tax=Peptoniphilus equinus TaxID=3016343 RepID=A0ABY7QWI9_9FIRM|nr:aspartate--ammonia ligase [Peptoniphilus equinus]WBW50640.1 aspartate--ammonia ligase [Peptoniphilus equinus]